MSTRPSAVLAALLVLGSIVAATPAAGVGTQSAANGSFGSTISSFMQSSTADAEGSVDNGMWAAGFADAEGEAQARMVNARIQVLERRLDRLESQRTALLNETAGNVTVADRARAARLSARADALRDAINQTETAGVAAGVDVTALERLRMNARALTGQEVAAIAVNISTGGGAPDRAANQSNADREGNETNHGAGGPPEDAPANDR